MNSKTRVKNTFRFEKTDRVPVNYMYNTGIDKKLKEYFGLHENDDEGLRVKLGVDFRCVDAPYTGPKLHDETPDRKTDPLYGNKMRWVENESGGHWERCDFLLEDADEEAVEKWPLPDPDDFDYESLIAQCEKHKEYGIVIGNSGLGLIICRAGFFRGFEKALIDLITDDAAGIRLIDRILDFQFRQTERMLDKIGDRTDVMWIGEDLGTQIGPLISKELFHKYILPRHKRFIDLASAYGVPVMLHTCGSSSWTFEDYIEAGLRAVDTLQPEARDMAPEYLKKNFGGRLVFHGCISTAGALTYGTKEDVEKVVIDTLDIMMPGSGYCLAPTHRLQDNTPVENAVAMYETAGIHGTYKS